MLDTNVFIAAIKDPKKQTPTLQLILALIEREEIHLLADQFMLEEMVRYAEEFRSEVASTLLSALISRTELADVADNHVRICRDHFKTPDLADIVHAAACLQENKILISNDKHFDRIRNRKIIPVWCISKAMKEIL